MYNNYMLSGPFSIGCYIRLSQEDKDKKYENESESVINQRNLVTDYIEYTFKKQFPNSNIFDYYVDDGYSGTNFDRPAFNRMLEDIRKKKINMVIVKDLSRLGRDHIETGYYKEIFFPENQIRFVSILENYDSFLQSTNDTTTFIMSFNDFYSQQNSIKIRTSLDNKRKQGKFIGSAPCFGYMRDPEDKNHLVPDPVTAPIVKEIFRLAEKGVGISEITTILNDKGYATPSGYKNIKYSSRLVFRDDWNISSVRKILKNRIYTGDMVQHKQAKASYKSEKKINLNEELWIVVEDTHEPLVSKKVFDMIQRRMKNSSNRTSTPTKRPIRLFDGLLYCKECKNKLSIAYRLNHDYWSVNCNRYSRDPARLRCSSHFFPYNYLENQLNEKICAVLNQYIKQLSIKDLNDEIIKRSKEIESNCNSELYLLEKRKEDVVKHMNAMYKDRIEGNISIEAYKEMVKPHEEELSTLVSKIETIKDDFQAEKDNLSMIPDYTARIKKLLDLNKPKRELYLSLIDRIEIDENRFITIKFKYGIIPNIEFQYEEPTTPRNPNGRRGKKNISK